MTIIFYKDGSFFVDERMCKQGDGIKKTMDYVENYMVCGLKRSLKSYTICWKFPRLNRSWIDALRYALSKMSAFFSNSLTKD